MILLSLALIVASAVALAWGLFAANDPLVWVSLAAGLGAVALIAGSVVRHRRRPVADGVPDAGPAIAGPASVGSASAGVDPAPSPTPYRPAPAPPAGPVSPPGTWAGAQTWPWATTPPGQSPDADQRPGWTGPVPAVSPPGQAAFPPDPAVSAPDAAVSPPAPGAARPEPPAVDASSAWGDPTAAPPAERTDPAAPPAVEPADTPVDTPEGEPGIERIPVRDALRVAQLPDEVVVVDGRPRYHLSDCPTLADAQPVPLAVSVARRGGFTPCAVCRPDATLLARSRARVTQPSDQDGAERASDGRQQL
ncbi:MAG TPA: hypothetical protein VGP36_03970 [Mycobacteriales bacterium]|nr:hypothetical protein [Mycobacteriales bacterium]